MYGAINSEAHDHASNYVRSNLSHDLINVQGLKHPQAVPAGPQYATSKVIVSIKNSKQHRGLGLVLACAPQKNAINIGGGNGRGILFNARGTSMGKTEQQSYLGRYQPALALTLCGRASIASCGKRNQSQGCSMRVKRPACSAHPALSTESVVVA